MRDAAAPVDAPFARGRIERLVCALHYAAAGGGACAAFLPAVAAWLVVAAVCALVGALLWRPVRGSLRWDGRSWSIVGPASLRPIDSPLLAVDLGDWMLVRLSEPGGRGARWASLRASDAAGRWHDLRVALLAHARAHGPAAPEGIR